MKTPLIKQESGLTNSGVMVINGEDSETKTAAKFIDS